MNFSQLQERVRLELLRRIERGTMSVSLLARQTGLGQAHVSNFLHGRRQLSLGTLDKMLLAQRMEVADLLPTRREEKGALLPDQIGEAGQVPLVAHSVAFGDPFMRPSNVQTMLEFQASMLSGLRERCTKSRQIWERFVAVRLTAGEARPMAPLLQANALLLIDRHYNSLRPYREGRANLYGVRMGPQLLVRYAEFKAGRLVLRPLGSGFPLEVIEPAAGETANDLVVGRVAMVMNEM